MAASSSTPTSPFPPLETLAESPPWDPSTVRIALNLRLDAAFVPRADGSGARVSFGHVVVLDDFFTEAQRHAMLTGIADEAAAEGRGGADPPAHAWERRTADGAGLPPTWGLTHAAMLRLEACDASTPLGEAMRQVQGRLCALYPEYVVGHMPSDAIQSAREMQHGDDDEEQSVPQEGVDTKDNLQHDKQAPACKKQRTTQQATVDQVTCGRFVANAAVAGDCFQWHIDADPSTFWPGPWVSRFGHYFNGEPQRPLLVTMLLYLDRAWPRDHDAETLFLDTSSDTGVLVRPKAYRAVLMDQDVVHRLSVPSRAAGRPRYSLVWKLVFWARDGDACRLARPAWGEPVHFGSAARMRALQQAVR